VASAVSADAIEIGRRHRGDDTARSLTHHPAQPVKPTVAWWTSDQSNLIDGDHEARPGSGRSSTTMGRS
jgi:hypothetical protein